MDHSLNKRHTRALQQIWRDLLLNLQIVLDASGAAGDQRQTDGGTPPQQLSQKRPGVRVKQRIQSSYLPLHVLSQFPSSRNQIRAAWSPHPASGDQSALSCSYITLRMDSPMPARPEKDTDIISLRSIQTAIKHHGVLFSHRTISAGKLSLFLNILRQTQTKAMTSARDPVTSPRSKVCPLSLRRTQAVLKGLNPLAETWASSLDLALCRISVTGPLRHVTRKRGSCPLPLLAEGNIVSEWAALGRSYTLG
ncbi:hypothetical protein G5714_021076 [Onychostoma macrolepis]|uniref:Uncharacterized protein n=1 Tax=Onychostoma macrolepis TaxID=369639 RepID=A0A7J6BVN3_9TELE|nr:hypothetical protein G5714_021076 [Onychostoma macrolepis]